MCVIAIKYFKDNGFVGVKNRDRNYSPTIIIKQSYKNNNERMLLWDKETKYTEGVNKYGIAILSSAVATKKDEKEVKKGKSSKNKSFYSPDGKKIRTALLEKTIDKAFNKLIELKLSGNTIVFTKDKCYLLESGINENGEYIFNKSEIGKNDVAVRTNHGIKIKWLGYQYGIDDKQDYSRKSSDERYKIALKYVKTAKTPNELFDSISNSDTNKDKQLNPLRVRTGKEGELYTTGQIMIIPKLNQLTYRPIECEIEFDWSKLNDPKSKTFFEIVSTRRLMNKKLESFKHYYFKNK